LVESMSSRQEWYNNPAIMFLINIFGFMI